MEGRFFLDVVVTERTPIFKLLSGEDQTLLIWRDSFLILDLRLHVLDGVAWLNLKGDGFACEGLHKNLHTTTQTENKMEGRFFLDVVVTERTPIFKLLSGEDQTLLIGRDSFLILDLRLHILDGVAWLNLEGDGFACEGLHKDLHTTT